MKIDGKNQLRAVRRCRPYRRATHDLGLVNEKLLKPLVLWALADDALANVDLPTEAVRVPANRNKVGMNADGCTTSRAHVSLNTRRVFDDHGRTRGAGWGEAAERRQ